MGASDAFQKLNERQREAAQAPQRPLLIIAGAGTGKTNTLAHRVAHLVLEGTAPDRILLLTFTRRAALEMTRRAQRIVGEALTPGPSPASGRGEHVQTFFRYYLHNENNSPHQPVLARRASLDGE